jgi:signal-transduction protein with cAMP-binding, CBS, and nucleotidyltransferase domain
MAVRDTAFTPADRGAHADVVAALDLLAPVVITSDATVQTAAQAMLRANRSSVVVGTWTVVTDRDIARAVALGRAPTTPAAAVVGVERAPIPGTTRVVDAFLTMLRDHVHELVVTDEDTNLVGVLDVATATEAVLGQAGGAEWIAALHVALDREITLE